MLNLVCLWEDDHRKIILSWYFALIMAEVFLSVGKREQYKIVAKQEH
jgi:hypothetical protein